MDFSIFEKKKKPLNEFCEIIVVDFVNKKEVMRTKINNLLPISPQQAHSIEDSIEEVSRITGEQIKKSEDPELLKIKEKQDFSA